MIFLITRLNQFFAKVAFKIFNFFFENFQKFWNHYSDKLDVTDETKNQIEAELKAAHITIKGTIINQGFVGPKASSKDGPLTPGRAMCLVIPATGEVLRKAFTVELYTVDFCTKDFRQKWRRWCRNSTKIRLFTGVICKIFEDITPAKNSISPENYRILTCGLMIIQLFKHNLKPRIRTIGLSQSSFGHAFPVEIWSMII